MSETARALHDVLFAGRLHFDGPPPVQLERDVVPVLEQAFAVHRLEVAGPALDFDAPSALGAAALLYHAGWLLLQPLAPVEGAALAMPLAARTPEQHLSADLCLRLLPTLLRRARARAADDVLTQALTDVLRRWPLSGVRADLEDGPLTTIDFGHDGLHLLYAERLAQHPRTAWFPHGAAALHVELVWQQLGRETSQLAHLQEMARAMSIAT
jgi:hypothetical protein